MYLDAQGGDDGLCVHKSGVAQVVEAVAAEDGSARLEPAGHLGALQGQLASSVSANASTLSISQRCLKSTKIVLACLERLLNRKSVAGVNLV